MKTTSNYPIIVTNDIEKSIAFYTNVLDYSIKHDHTTRAQSRVVVIANEKGNQIELMEASDKMPDTMTPGMHGMRINVDDIEAAYQEVKAAGCEIVSEIFETGLGKNLLIKDNNGVNITLMQHVKKN